MPTHNYNFDAIPDELKQYKNWCLWKYEDVGKEKLSKVPYQINGYGCSVNDKNHWANFNQCFNIFNNSNYDGLGFIFTNTPYSGIDLDECQEPIDIQRQIKIFNEFDSYSEKSPSGKGLHIIVKGNVSSGLKRTPVELYSIGRYFTMTGNVYVAKPIADRQDLLTQLWRQMGGEDSKVITVDSDQVISDQEVVNLALAHNTTIFEPLHNGDWRGRYPTQSEADQAYMNFIAAYTNSREQCDRIFRKSKLFRAEKNKGYIPRTIKTAFDLKLPPIDFQGYKNDIEEQLKLPFDAKKLNGSVAQRSVPAAHNSTDVGSSPTTSTNVHSTITPPQGLVGEIAQFIYEAAPRPVPEIAVAAAIGLMAGICGKTYNISGTGLNQYILCLAMTGAGKEAMASGIDKIINELSKVPVVYASEFIGPSRIASGQALYKYMANKSQCFVSIIGEFGKRLEAMSSKGANSAEKQLIAELLDLYNKSGYGQTSKPSIYSDQDKNTVTIQSPAFTILGESTPDTFYSILNEDMIADGLLPRFMLIEYNGPRPSFNENHGSVLPSPQLISKISDLMAHSKTIMHSKRVIDIERTPSAAKLLSEFDKLSDKQINTTDKETVRQLWNRAHIKVLKIAGLLAVGRNYVFPRVEDEDVLWARNVVEHDIRALSKKFEDGDIGLSSEEIKQLKEFKRMIKSYFVEPFDEISKYEPDQRFYSARIIRNNYLQQRLYGLASFRKDKVGKANAFARGIKNMLDNGILVEVPKIELLNTYSFNGKAYRLSDMRIISND